MRKKGGWALLLLTLLCCLGFAVYLVLSERMVDKTAPEISFTSEILDVSVNDSEEYLLTGVSANDEQDGDVTSSVLVEGISALSANQTATVTYAAFDEAGNVAKATRTLRYTDYHSPRFSLSTALVFRNGTSVNLLNYISAEDMIDGVLDDRIKATPVSKEYSINEVGTYDVEFRVTNSMRDTAYLTVPVEIVPTGLYNATVVLTDYLIYIKEGSAFLCEEYLKELQIGAEKISLQGNPSDVSISYDSDVNTNVPGTYSVAYTVKTGSHSGYTRLIVIVGE